MKVLITGANTGIGRVTAETLARNGAHVVIAGRSKEKTEPVVRGIVAGSAAGGTAHTAKDGKKGSAEFLPLDLGDLGSVRACCKTLLDKGEPIDVLVANAGLAGTRGVTKQGFEMTFGTNHLGHFLLVTELLPLLRKATPSRIVVVASQAHFRAPRNDSGIDWKALREPTKTISGFPEYGVSKLCNVLFVKELARGRAGVGVHSYALHPGVVASDVWRKVPWPFRSLMKLRMLTTEEGARTSLYCATSPDVADHDGRYYDDCKEVPCSKLADDPALAKTLWQKSEEWVGSAT
jgi:NAD(P)-dependent dehydrogenase (short-subunit alcohol dehydrogenase family)